MDCRNAVVTFGFGLWLVATHAGAEAESSAEDFLAGAPRLFLPVDCEVGTPRNGRCWLQNLVDHDKGPKVADFMCGARSYNASSRFGTMHQGVDIGVYDTADFNFRINVLAAAPGRIRGMRDGMEDRRVLRGQEDAEIREKACGNAVVIDHGKGWETQYCHMRQGSVQVKVGDQVETGDILGAVGLSGLTSYPHLHFQVMYIEDGQRIPVDPFDGTKLLESCEDQRRPLFDASALDTLIYRPVEVIKLGFTIGDVSGMNLLQGLRPSPRIRLTDEDPVSVFAYFAGSHVGDVARLDVKGPDGRTVLSGSRATSHYRNRQFVSAGLSTARRFNGQPGRYRVTFTVMDKDGNLLVEQTANMVLSSASAGW